VETSTEVDLKPVVLDQCVALRLRDLPSTHIRQPYEQRIAFTLFGREVFGISMCGEWQTRVNENRGGPFVITGGDRQRAQRPCDDKGEDRGGGLRIRLSD
jgi:hypothetical protein